jgi:hypothetical protein
VNGKPGKELDYRDTPQTIRWRKQINTLNDVSAASKIEYFGEDGERFKLRTYVKAVWSARARSTQVRSADCVRSRLRATCGIVLPSSRTSWIAPALKLVGEGPTRPP